MMIFRRQTHLQNIHTIPSKFSGFNRLVTQIIILIIFSGVLIAQPLADSLDKFLGAGSCGNIYPYFDEYWNQLSPGNDGKWGSVESVMDQYNWTNLDKLYNYAESRDILFKEHTLVWGNQQPGWISTLDSAEQRNQVEEWIKLVCERYPAMGMIDVVNEPIHAPPSYMNALGGNGKTGWDWIITAFEMARQYSTAGTQLILNEYNILHDIDATTEYLQIIDTLKTRGLIDGIGIQGHYFEFRSDLNASNTYVYDIGTIKSNLDRLADTGIPVYITEFDIDEPNDADQLAQYQIYFPIFWYHPAVKGITFWGYFEGDVWNSHPDTYLINADNTERPALQWLRTFILSPVPPEPIYPNYDSNVPRNLVLKWYSSAKAASYHVQISTNLQFTGIVVDSTISDTLMQSTVLEASKRYSWRVSATNEYGESDFSNTLGFTTGTEITSLVNAKVQPASFTLFQNYPNPFNPETTISFQLPERSFVQLDLFNSVGEKIFNLTNRQFEAGLHSIRLNGSVLSSGIYFYRLSTKKFTETKKLVVLK